MIVLDASALVEYLLQTPLGEHVERRLFADDDDLHAPHLIDVEVLQSLRRLVRAGELSRQRAADALVDWADMQVFRHAHMDLASRAWELRDNITAYDGVYVALAEALGAPLLTCDAKLATAPGHRAHVEVIA